MRCLLLAGKTATKAIRAFSLTGTFLFTAAVLWPVLSVRGVSFPPLLSAVFYAHTEA